MLKRIQLKRAKGWRMPQNTVIVSRPGKWGNPFIVGKHGTQAECVDNYDWLTIGIFSEEMDNLREQKSVFAFIEKNIEKLKGKNLACWCKNETPCHADILLEIANVTRW